MNSKVKTAITAACTCDPELYRAQLPEAFRNIEAQTEAKNALGVNAIDPNNVEHRNAVLLAFIKIGGAAQFRSEHPFPKDN